MKTEIMEEEIEYLNSKIPGLKHGLERQEFKFKQMMARKTPLSKREQEVRLKSIENLKKEISIIRNILINIK